MVERPFGKLVASHERSYREGHQKVFLAPCFASDIFNLFGKEPHACGQVHGASRTDHQTFGGGEGSRAQSHKIKWDSLFQGQNGEKGCEKRATKEEGSGSNVQNRRRN
jgi:hypothetical protein